MSKYISKIQSINVGKLFHPVYRDFNGQQRVVTREGKIPIFLNYHDCRVYIDTVLKPEITKEVNAENYKKRYPFYRLGFLRKPYIAYNEMPNRERTIDLNQMLNSLSVGQR